MSQRPFISVLHLILEQVLHVQDVTFVYNPSETAFDYVFASVAITAVIIPGDLATCNPSEQDKISILGYLSSL